MVAAVPAPVLGTVGGAVAGSVTTGAEIRNGSIRGVGVGNGSLTGTDPRTAPSGWPS